MQPLANNLIEKRTRRRRAVSLKGEILLGKYYPTVDCRICDISEKGARLVLSNPMILPTKFRLHVVKNRQLHNVKTVWRTEETVGVVFEGEINTVT